MPGMMDWATTRKPAYPITAVAKVCRPCTSARCSAATPCRSWSGDAKDATSSGTTPPVLPVEEGVPPTAAWPGGGRRGEAGAAPKPAASSSAKLPPRAALAAVAAFSLATRSFSLALESITREKKMLLYTNTCWRASSAPLRGATEPATMAMAPSVAASTKSERTWRGVVGVGVGAYGVVE